MRRKLVATLAVPFLALAAFAFGANAQALTLEDRTRAHRAVQRLYYAHQIGNTASFDDAVSLAVSEQQVRTSLKESVALAKFWNIHVSDERLAREVRRILRDSKDPERLRAIRAVLGDDPVLFAEVVARPLVVRAIARNQFNHDPVIHAATRGHAESIAERLRKGTLDARRPHDDRTAVRIERSKEPREFSRWKQRLGTTGRSLPRVEELRTAFVVRVLLEENADEIRFASYFVSKISWGSWWEAVQEELEASNATIAGPATVKAAASTEADSSCAPDNTWASGALQGIAERAGHTLVWTGTEMIVWGGATNDFQYSPVVDQGARYDPLTDTWSMMTTTGAPLGRAYHSAVWTGREMIVWGGSRTGGAGLADGARYDPVLDRWTPVSNAGAPIGRYYHAAIWTGRQMVLWGGDPGTGLELGDGGRYDPEVDRWAPVSTLNAPPGRSMPTAIWTGAEMVVWGGQAAGVADVMFGDGGRYDPTTDQWTPVATGGAPSPRWGHSTVWTGTEMIVWGGSNRSNLAVLFSDGARYRPSTNSWLPMNSVGAPPNQAGHSAQWSGEFMIVWSGQGGSAPTYAGKRYRPATDEWLSVTSTGIPPNPPFHRSIWTGTEMIVWGGGDNSVPQLNSGGRYDPVLDRWRPTSTGNGPPEAVLHTAVWTGNEMITWGGWGGIDVDNFPTEGGRFDPALDAWIPMTTVGALAGRERHTSVWTGSRMVVWGGVSLVGGGETVFGDGALYDPLTDTWAPTAASNAPAPRRMHTAIWSGSRMIVWGGLNTSDRAISDGGRYDPLLNQWQSVSTLNTPPARNLHTAVWTGSIMIVWGGVGASGGELRSGGRYNPTTDTWTGLSLTGAPTARYFHTAVWTASRMVVWGGLGQAQTGLNTGGRYDPGNDTWSATSVVAAPAERHSHTAIWTGSEMIVWGGERLANSTGVEYLSGGRYEPAANSWRSTEVIHAPAARADHVAVWAGNQMLIWSGENNPYTTGGTYVVGPPDADSDGVADACDCAAGDASATAIPTEAATLRFASDKTALTWYASTGGSGTVHDVARGSLATFPVGSGGESCLASGLTESRLDDPETPAGGGYWYLVHGRNACGPGTYGEATGGTRTTATCP